MGGVAGHMDHLYDNRDLTFSEMKKIMEAGANAELDVEEKVDGQNLFLSYSVKNDELVGVPESGGRAKGARNKGNLKAGGLDAVGLAKKFAGRGPLEKAFTGAFSAFEKAVEALSDEEKVRIFGPDTDIWYNAEVMDPGNVNVILYDNKTLKIHDVGHFSFDRETGEKSPIPEGTLEALDSVIEKMRQALEGDEYNIARRAAIELKNLEDKSFLNKAISKLDSSLAAEGLTDSATVQDFLFSRLMNGIQTDLPQNLKKELVKYLLGMPGNIGKRALKSGLSNEDKKDLDNIVANRRNLLLEAIMPIEFIVHEYTVEILKGLKSVFIADTNKEVERLKKELSLAVRSLTASGAENPLTMEIMQRHLNKIKDFSQITTPIEAVVFDYNGHTYKFAGNFAPLNQILGMFKYPKGNKKITTESIEYTVSSLTEQDGKRIALFPGKFKPPHRGHFDYVNKIAKRSDVDEVIILISPVDYPEVSNEQSLEIWNEYLKNGESNITAKIADYRSPVQAVYEFVADPTTAREGDTILLIKSSKDVGDTRFDRAQSYAERNNPGVNVEDIIEDPVESSDGIVYSARDMRKAIISGDKETFLSYIPPSVDADSIWNSLTSNNQSLNSLIDDTIEEISSMSGGSVSGYAGGFGPPNTFNPYKKRAKISRPKVKRAKRQRRR